MPCSQALISLLSRLIFVAAVEISYPAFSLAHFRTAGVTRAFYFAMAIPQEIRGITLSYQLVAREQGPSHGNSGVIGFKWTAA